jgi:CheY-like chemotaxis protein
LPVKKILWSESIRSKVEAGGPRFLSRTSVKAFSASEYSQFLEIVAQEQIDLILLEADATDLPAVEICRRLSNDGTTRSIPILVLSGNGHDIEILQEAGCAGVIGAGTSPEALQQRIAEALGMRLRRHPRYPVVLPVARGRLFHEFLGYSNSLSEGGMGFDTIVRVREGDQLPFRLYRNSEEKPIGVTGRVCGVRPNLETGVGYTVGVEFLRLSTSDRGRLAELFPPEPCVTWGSENP